MGFAEVPSQPGCVLLMDTNGKIGMFDLNASEAEPVKLIPGMELTLAMASSSTRPIRISSFVVREESP